jgi:hypothetical protein
VENTIGVERPTKESRTNGKNMRNSNKGAVIKKSRQKRANQASAGPGLTTEAGPWGITRCGRGRPELRHERPTRSNRPRPGTKNTSGIQRSTPTPTPAKPQEGTRLKARVSPTPGYSPNRVQVRGEGHEKPGMVNAER